MHAAAIRGGAVVEPIQVKQAVENVEGDFVIHRLPIFGGVPAGGFGADHDIAVVEGNDVRGPLDGHELCMDLRDAPVRNECDPYLVERTQGEAAIGAARANFLERHGGEATQPGKIEGDAALEIADNEHSGWVRGTVIGIQQDPVWNTSHELSREGRTMKFHVCFPERSLRVRRMSRLSQTLRKKWWRIPVGVWLTVFLLFLAGGVVFSIFFVRRNVIEYQPPHQFSVRDPAFFGSAHALGDPLPVAGNKITLLHNGDQIFPAMLTAIRGAKASVNFEAFLFNSGTVGSAFRDAFVERARAGVKVRVLLDGLGSSSKLKNEDVEAMRAGGCHFAYYHPTHSWRIDRINRRTHRRILVIDGRLAFTGGVGFADEWQGNADSPQHWREVHAQIEGPLVAKLQGAFQQHWVRATGEALGGIHEFPTLAPVGPLRAQMTASHSYSIAPLPLLQAVAIASADKRISITNAYCTPTDDQVALLNAAVQRGVDVQMLLPGKHHDQPATKAAGRTAYGKLLTGGVKIFEYSPTMIHSKTMVVDGMFAIFGTSNLDTRSAMINEELDISVYDEGFGRQMETVFDADLKNAKPYTLEQFKKRSLWERMSEALTMPFHSQL